MTDLLLVAVIVVFFAAAALLVRVIDGMIARSGEPDTAGEPDGTELEPGNRR